MKYAEILELYFYLLFIILFAGFVYCFCLLFLFIKEINEGYSVRRAKELSLGVG